MRPNHLFAAAVVTLAMSASAIADVDPTDLSGPVAEYKAYVTERTERLVEGTSEFVDAIKAGDLERARALYAPTRVPYEEIEPIAELFGDLDAAIDSRADDYELAEADPGFPGFHRIEYGLWAKNSTEGLEPVADKLLADVTQLRDSIADLEFPPDVVVGGAAELIEEIAESKISGEENRYSRTDLWDFKANVDGAHKIVELVRPLIEDEEAEYLATVDANFARVYDILETYEKGDGYVTYLELGESDRVTLAAAVNTLAEDLSTLRGKFGLD